MKFLDDFDKEVDKIDGVLSSSKPPETWYSTGNYVLNKIISGSFNKGIPEGRLTGFAGPSGAGKSFLIGNVAKGAQQDGSFVLVIDSENALDDEYMSSIGVDVTSNYKYKQVTTIDQCNKVVSTFLKAYNKEYDGNKDKMPKVLVIIDSLDMLMTESELNNFDSGIMKGDQGQRAKQMKSMLRNFTNAIKGTSVAIALTTQVYKATPEQMLSGEETWVVNNAIKFALSQILLLTKLKLRDEQDKGNVLGIRMKCECIKTRFTKPFQKVVVEVPYQSGMDSYSGLLDALVECGLVEQNKAWYTIKSSGIKFQRAKFDQYANELLLEAENSKASLSISKDLLNSSIEVEDDSSDEISKGKKNKS